MKLVSALFKAARLANDVRSVGKVASGDYEHGVRRVKNKLLGRILGKLGLWR